MYQPENPVITIDPDALQRQGLQKFTTNVLSELNRVYTSETNTTFTEALLNTKSAGLEKKKTKMQKKKEKREAEKMLTRRVNEQFAERAALTMLVEGESKRKYHRNGWLSPSAHLENNLHKKRKLTLQSLMTFLGMLQG